MLPDPKIVNHKLYAQLYAECFEPRIDLFKQGADDFLTWLCNYADAHFNDRSMFVGKPYLVGAQDHQDRFFELQAEALRIGREMLDDHKPCGGSRGE